MKELNLGKPSNNQVQRDNKFRKNAATFMENYNRSLMESEENEKQLRENAAMSAARFGYSATIERSKNRINSLNEEIKYNNTSSIIGMTEMVAQVVENALLLDEEEYASLNPNYKEEIREIISGFLSEGNINTEIDNLTTLQLMEHVARSLPDSKIGKTLTEEEVAKTVKDKNTKEVDESIKKLSRKVSGKVADLVDKEQKKAEKINADIQKVTPAEEVPAEEMPVDENGNPVEEIPQENMEQPVDENGNPVEEVPAEQPAEEMPVDENGNPIEAAPQQSGRNIHIDVDGTTSIQMPNGQLALNNDGSMDIQLMENRLVRETMRCGLIESLAVNEAKNMLKEGKGYNPDLCLANAIMYVTITEAMNEMGLMNVGEKEYSQIISAAGGCLNEITKAQKKWANENKNSKDPDVKDKAESLLDKDYYGKAAAKGFKNGEVVRPYQYVHRGQEAARNVKIAQMRIDARNPSNKNEQNAPGSESNEKQKVVTESVIYSQHVPTLNSSYDGNSLAERLRQKRLNEEAQNRTLHD